MTGIKLLGYDFLSKQIPCKYYLLLGVCRCPHQSHGSLLLGFMYARKERDHLLWKAVSTPGDTIISVVHREVKYLPSVRSQFLSQELTLTLCVMAHTLFFHVLFLLMHILFFFLYEEACKLKLDLSRALFYCRTASSFEFFWIFEFWNKNYATLHLTLLSH